MTTSPKAPSEDRIDRPATNIDDPLRKAFAERGYLFADDVLRSDAELFASHDSLLDWLRKQRDEGVPIAGKIDRKIFISIDALIAKGMANYMRTSVSLTNEN